MALENDSLRGQSGTLEWNAWAEACDAALDGLAKRERLVEQPLGAEASRGFEPRSLDSESRVLTVTPRGHGVNWRQWHLRTIACGARVERLSGTLGQVLVMMLRLKD